MSRENPTYLIVDLEATCTDSNEFPRSQMEIIEIGAVAVNGTDFTIIDEFSEFVKPTRNPVLTEFCRRLTSSRQCDVDKAGVFSIVCQRFHDWVARHPDGIFCSWGNYDRNQLIQDCMRHRVPYPFASDYHINIKSRFAKQQGIGKKVGMQKALKLTGIPLEGTHHRGIDDARNMVKLLPYIFGVARIGK